MRWITHCSAVVKPFAKLGIVLTQCFCNVANLNKVPHGGWFALAIAGGVFGLSYLWWWGTNTKHKGIVATQVTSFPSQ